MKISENWLRECVNLNGISSAELLDKLTAAGLEVESVTAVAGIFDGVVVGEIIECQQHPDADRLRICAVNAGLEQPLQIVCGAPNARVGLKAPLATIGANLPGLVIKLGKLRGVESFGMLCSATELGLPAEQDGLFELPADAPVGQNLRHYLDLDDQIVELKMTPNRSDCLGLIGLTRELCALFDRPALVKLENPIVPQISDSIGVKIEATEACASYASATVHGIDTSLKTPLWMKEKLRRSGIRSIHPVVDITNFVMLETGQPMHGFDAELLQGGIVVRFAKLGEQLELLDGQTVVLNPEILNICDSAGPLAVAGIMGGMRSRVTESTRNIVFEAAHFTPSAIMGRARKLGLHTDSSHRFERGVDPALPKIALARAVSLLLEICGGKTGPLKLCDGSSAPAQSNVTLRRSFLDAILGLTIPDANVTAILTALGFSVRFDEGAGIWTTLAPSARFDIAIEADLAEEVARVYGYEHIPTTLPTLELAPETQIENVASGVETRHALLARGYQEAITFAFTSAALLRNWGLQGHAIKNPLSSDIDSMRPSLLPNLVQAVVYNQRRQLDRVRFFEIGVSFHDLGLIEKNVIAGVVTGNVQIELWSSTARAVDFYDVKGDLEALIAGAYFESASENSLRPSYLHPGRSASVLVDTRCVGFVGELHPELKRTLDLRGSVLVFEVELAAVQARKVTLSTNISKFPSVRRDLAFVLTEAITWNALEHCVSTSAGKALISVNCFDVYRGAGLPESYKSLAISLIFQDISRTLSEQEIDAAINNIIAAVNTTLGGELRR